MKGNKVNEVLNRLHLAVPNKRDDKVGGLSRSLGGGSVVLLTQWTRRVPSPGGHSSGDMHMQSGLEFLTQTKKMYVVCEGEVPSYSLLTAPAAAAVTYRDLLRNIISIKVYFEKIFKCRNILFQIFHFLAVMNSAQVHLFIHRSLFLFASVSVNFKVWPDDIIVLAECLTSCRALTAACTVGVGVVCQSSQLKVVKGGRLNSAGHCIVWN